MLSLGLKETACSPDTVTAKNSSSQVLPFTLTDVSPGQSRRSPRSVSASLDSNRMTASSFSDPKLRSEMNLGVSVSSIWRPHLMFRYRVTCLNLKVQPHQELKTESSRRWANFCHNQHFWDFLWQLVNFHWISSYRIWTIKKTTYCVLKQFLHDMLLSGREGALLLWGSELLLWKKYDKNWEFPDFFAFLLFFMLKKLNFPVQITFFDWIKNQLFL